MRYCVPGFETARPVARILLIQEFTWCSPQAPSTGTHMPEPHLNKKLRLIKFSNQSQTMILWTELRLILLSRYV